MRELYITKKESSVSKQNLDEKECSLLRQIEELVELFDDFDLDEVLFLEGAKQVACKLQLTELQAILLSHCINKYDDYRISAYEIAQSVKCSRVRILQYADDFDELLKRKLIRHRLSSDKTVSYSVPVEVINSLKYNKEYVPVNYKNISIDQFFDILENLFEQRNNDELSYSSLLNELDTLMNENEQLEFVKKIKDYHLGSVEKVLLFFFCHSLVNEEDDEMRFGDFDDLYDSKSTFRHIKNLLKDREGELMGKGLLENTNSNGFGDREQFKLSDKAKNELLSELNLNEKQSENKKNLLLSASLPVKKLFYNEQESAQVQQLTSLLRVDNFKTVQARLKDNGMRTGFACRFSGNRKDGNRVSIGT
ncbi:MAG: hypothetical protein EZS26_001963 [Candidatus Ordinivivax streblomastigis]|uniref:Uncharacterized protein n=1 Tax=Candidatus Ordinivivax streblomastigis TaxID=2540710 RepID=A0A5M8P0U5_9BACT|nr:MAG: hypothetical protein EZS26_001963 [Candidatus Ordinivivax streblomastigis]